MMGLFFAAAFFSEVLGTMAGFGSSTLFLPLALLFIDFKNALVLVAFLHIFGNITRVGFFRHGLDGKLLIKFGFPSVIFSVIGAMLVSYTPQILLKGFLGVFLVSYSIYSLWKENFSVPPTSANTMLGGTLSGFVAGLI